MKEKCSSVEVACAERDRLDEAYYAALQDKYALESELGPQLDNRDANVRKRAKKQIEKASGRASHILNEWLNHWKKHRCR